MSDWQPEVDEIRRRKAMALEMGGPDKVARQHANGRLTVRERIEGFLDDGSFCEIGGLAGSATYEGGQLVAFQPTNFVMGRGRVAGRSVVVAGDDFTVRGGSSEASIWEKQVAAERMAHDLRLPIVRFVEGSGGGGSVRSMEKIGRTYVPGDAGWQWMFLNLGRVPVVSMALGPVAGLGAAKIAASHYSVMVRGVSQVFVAGPPVVARAGEQVDKETLGGSGVHGQNGVVDDVVDSEPEALARGRRLLSYLPPSVFDLPPRDDPTDPSDRRDDWLIGAIPRNRRAGFKVRSIIEAVVDRDSFFEIGAGWGRATVTGLARLAGWPIAIMANDPYMSGGGWGAAASEKVVRFIDLADTFHLPVVHLVDQPGFMIGTASEREGTIRYGTRAMAAIYQATVPWCTVLLRRSFGVAGAAVQNHARYTYRFAWPSGDWGSLPIEGGIEAAFRAEIEAAPDPAARVAEIEEAFNLMRSPLRTAEAFGVEDIVDPRDTRPLLCDFAELAAPLRQPGVTARSFRP